MYRNHDTVRRVTVLNLKVQELQLQLESHAVSRDDANAYSTALHQIKSNQQVQWFKGRVITFIVHFMVD